ncbi:hypothetical protein EDB82DRAFT_474330 [Fusarium venenatum]|uniref:uncharacterized protein n=1 Tax=Fusarium venenatum TaxID=56646 RepID=UPI001D1D4F2E|nr:hypothetical protein EDB82DRAFT_474330 [Fusarium venenatum]
MAQPYAKVGQPQVYQRYYSEPRPGDKLPPLDYGEVCHRFLRLILFYKADQTRADVFISFLAKDTVDGDIPSLKFSARIVVQRYAAGPYAILASSPPAPQQDCQNSSSGSTRPKAEHGMQDYDEIQVQQKDDVEQTEFPYVLGNRQVRVCGEEKQPLYLKIEGLQLGPQEESDRHSAVRLCTLFNQHQSSMPRRVRSRLLHLLTGGQFQHNAQSVFQPLKHQLSMHMYDEEVGEANWISVTYERWFILVGIYGWGMLREHAGCIRKAVVMRYGEPIDGDLTFKNSSDNSGSIKQIDRLNAIVGVQPCPGPGKHMDDGDNDVGMGHEVSQGHEGDTGSSYSTPEQLTGITTSRKRVHHG